MDAVYEDFAPLGSYWNTYVLGSGALEPTGSTLRFVNVDTTSRQVTVAQIDDYQGLPRRRYLWRPPLTMAVRARFSHPGVGTHGADGHSENAQRPFAPLHGTAGFGFWNDPFMMTGRWSLTLPRAIWFFYASPRSNMKLDLKAPGHGWKAATLDALRPSSLLLTLAAPVAIPLMNVRPVYRLLWPVIQRAIGVCEASIQADMTEWHTYVIEWGVRSARFEVDEETVMVCEMSPRGPLGFVMWLDNQYLVATPWGKFRYGWLDAPGRQWMEVDRLSISARHKFDSPPLVDRLAQAGDQ